MLPVPRLMLHVVAVFGIAVFRNVTQALNKHDAENSSYEYHNKKVHINV
jgi:hypothetical protein